MGVEGRDEGEGEGQDGEGEVVVGTDREVPGGTAREGHGPLASLWACLQDLLHRRYTSSRCRHLLCKSTRELEDARRTQGVPPSPSRF